MKDQIAGRKREQKLLAQLLTSKRAEFLAVYGRRRVGKTHLIREFFKDKGVFFEAAGVKDLALSGQLENFSRALSRTFFEEVPLKRPLSWNDAFELLTKQLETLPQRKKVILFLDELPWLASRRSGFVPALDHFWNLRWSRMQNVILVVCGSAASWMLDHIVNAKGGLYNRVTKRLLLEPFNLLETEEFITDVCDVRLSRRQILDLYMVVGGIPFYLLEVKKGRSTAQLVDELCFNRNGLLYSEFTNVFRSLFDHSEVNQQIVREIAKAGNLSSREQLIAATGLSSGGTLNRRLEELEAAQFIKCFVPLGKQRRDRFYRIIDEYSLFYLKWIEPVIRTGTFSGQGGHWQRLTRKPEKLGWAGLAFESICFKHVSQIERALRLEIMNSRAGSWRHIPPKNSKANGAQIDLLFDRDDDVITVCEMKYSENPYVIDKAYARLLTNKIDVLEKNYPSRRRPTQKQIFLAMVTSTGLKPNLHSEDLIQNEVVLDDLFSL